MHGTQVPCRNPRATRAQSLHRSFTMATHPVQPEADPLGTEPAAPNPTRLPVEPEFGPLEPGAEPDDPGVKHPEI